MKKILLLSSLFSVFAWPASRAQSGPFDLSWNTVDGGGGSASNGNFTISGTIGQPDAGVMSAGQFTLQGGFWNAPLGTTPISPAAGIISRWPGDGHPLDIVGPNRGTLSGGAGYTNCEVDQAFSFDGVSGMLQAPTAGFPTNNANRTLEMWVKVDSFGAGETFFAGYGAFGQGGETFQLGAANSGNRGTLFFSQWGGGLYGPALQTNTWYHIAVVNVGNSVTLYLDGAAVASGNLSINTPPGTSFYLGKAPTPYDATRKLQGEVDEAAVYNRALSSSEISAIYEAGTHGPQKPPIIILPSPPTIIVQPGGDLIVAPQASGDGPFTYQWYSPPGQALVGQTNAALTLHNVQNGGVYVLIITGPYGAVTNTTTVVTAQVNLSDFRLRGHILSIDDPAGLLDSTVKPGTPLTGDYSFDPLLADSNADPTIGEYDNSDPNAGIRLLTGDYSFGTDPSTSGLQIQIVDRAPDAYLVRSSHNQVAAGLRIDQISWQLSDPAGVTLTNDTLPTLPPPLALWQQNASVTITGGRTNDLVGFGGSFTIHATIDALSDVAVATPPFIGLPAPSQSVKPGSSVFFSPSVSSGNGQGTAIYQWRFDGTNVPGGAGLGLTLTNVQSAQAGDYTLYFSTSAGSDSAVTTLSLGLPPVIVKAPTNQVVAVGSNVVFSVIVTGAPPFAIQWQFKGTNLPGANSTNLALGPVQSAQGGSYTVLVQNSFGSASSSNVLTVNGAPFILTQPQDQVALAGSTAQFSVGADGPAPLHYQWMRGVTNLTGKTNVTLVLTNVQPSFQADNYSVLIKNNFGAVTSRLARLTLEVPPIITLQPKGQTAIVGTNVVLSVAATGSGTLTYQWAKDGINLPGAVATNLVISNIQLAQAGNYTVGISNIFGGARSTNALVVVWMPPLIVLQPADQAVVAGTNVTLSVSAIGTTNLGYQWRYRSSANGNAADIAGAKGATLVLTNIVAAKAGLYSVVITNIAGKVTSRDANLTVYVPAAITLQPKGLTVLVGSNALLTVAASGTGPLAYQWTKDGTNLAGATSTNLLLTNIQLAQSGNYRVAVSNLFGAVLSTNALVKVLMPPLITAQPADYAVIAKSNATFSVTAIGTTNLSYQWRFKAASGGAASDLAGATSTNLVLTNLLSANEGTYSVVVTNIAGRVTSREATLTVFVPPTIITSPQSATVNVGASLTLTVSATGDKRVPLHYQWRKDGVNIGGATNTSLALTNLQVGASGNYSALASNPYGQAGSAVATLKVVAPIAITLQPQSQTNIAGNNVTFGVVATGSPPLAYQWRKDGKNIAGATRSTLTLGGLKDADAGSYQVVITNLSATVTSATATLTVGNPPSITTQPQKQTVLAGASASFTVAAKGTPPFLYQWIKDGAAIAGATNATLSLGAVSNLSEGVFWVLVKNPYGQDESVLAELTVHAAPSFAAQPSSQSVLAGDTAMFTVAAIGDDPLTYQWTKNGTNIAGATKTLLVVTNVQVSSVAAYAVMVKNPFGVITSSNALLTIVSAPVITSQPQSVTVAAGSNVTFSVVASGSAPLGYQWYLNGSPLVNGGRIAGAFSSTLTIANVQGSDAGNLSAVVANSIGSVTSSNAALTVDSQGSGAVSSYTFSTLAGLPSEGSADGTGSAAQFFFPEAVAVDSSHNLYVVDVYNQTIRKITSTGVVTTLAGQAGLIGTNDGIGSAARFGFPRGITIDDSGNLYVADTDNETIRKVTPSGVVTTLAGQAGSEGSADGTGSAAQFSYAQGITIDASGNLYVSETGNNTIRKITPEGAVTTLAGQAGVSGSDDGTGSAARFNSPQGVVVDSSGNVYVADTGNNTIRKITSAGIVTTLAGQPGSIGSDDGQGGVALFDQPVGITLDSSGDLYVADGGNNTIRKISSSGVVSTLAGASQDLDGDGVPDHGSADGIGDNAQFYLPTGVVIDGSNGIYVADFANQTIRKITLAGSVTTFAGQSGSAGSADGVRNNARFNFPESIAIDSSTNLYVADANNDAIGKITPAGTVTTLAGQVGTAGSADGNGSGARFDSPEGLAVDSSGNLYVADTGNNTIRKIDSGGNVTTLAGLAGVGGGADGSGSAARFQFPQGLAVDGAGNIYVADSGNDAIRKITSAGVVTTLAGNAGSKNNPAQFLYPEGVAVDSFGNVYVADTYDNLISEITPGGVVTTVAGQTAGLRGNVDGIGTNATFDLPVGIAVDSSGNLYVVEADTFFNAYGYNDNTIRKVTIGGVVTTVGGSAASPGSADGTGNASRFYLPYGIAVDSGGNLYVADSYNNTIRKGVPSGAGLSSFTEIPFAPNSGVARKSITIPNVAVSAPAAPMLRPALNNGVFQLTVATENGRRYTLESTDSLGEANWTPIATVTGDGTVMPLNDPRATRAQRFYRVREE